MPGGSKPVRGRRGVEAPERLVDGQRPEVRAQDLDAHQAVPPAVEQRGREPVERQSEPAGLPGDEGAGLRTDRLHRVIRRDLWTGPGGALCGGQGRAPGADQRDRHRGDRARDPGQRGPAVRRSSTRWRTPAPGWESSEILQPGCHEVVGLLNRTRPQGRGVGPACGLRRSEDLDPHLGARGQPSERGRSVVLAVGEHRRHGDEPLRVLTQGLHRRPARPLVGRRCPRRPA